MNSVMVKIGRFFRIPSVIVVLFLLFMPANVSAAEYTLAFIFSHVIEPQSIKLIDMQLLKGEAAVSPVQEGKAYTLRIISEARTTLFVTKFDPPQFFNPDGGAVKSYEKNAELTPPSGFPFFINAPYFLDSTQIEVSDATNKIVLALPIPPLRQLAEKTVKAAAEGTLGKLPPLKSEPSIAIQNQESQNSKNKNGVVFILIGVGIFVFVGIIGIFMRRKYKKNVSNIV